ncbi:RHS repeat-associated core domain-containing protein, partial [Streptomyces sp. ME19-01-6]|uniref:RHS repeat-associated core domain-containing protein n=1 Tax=Streptomyces sp. ME19-01-6 TaxID=3028686 RepID=UPI0029A42229
GQYHDPETGLHYNRFRYYDPETARYTSPDPLGLTAAPNPATYVTNPHAWIDPLGLSPCTPDTLSAGRPDGETVFSGHGGISVDEVLDLAEGAQTTVPEGTRLHLYNSHAAPLEGARANRIELGTEPVVLEHTVEPGGRVWNYSLFPPTDDMTIMGNPVTVTKETRLSELLQPNMGNVHWAACRSEIW